MKIILNCYFCGEKFFDTPESAQIGWDDTAPVYVCVSCEIALRFQEDVLPKESRYAGD